MRVIHALEVECGNVEGMRIGIWGLAFKAGTDDIPDSLALRIVEELGRRGATLQIYNSEWPEFGEIAPSSYAHLITRLVVDARNVLDPARVVGAGLTYRGIGTRAGGAVVACGRPLRRFLGEG